MIEYQTILKRREVLWFSVVKTRKLLTEKKRRLSWKNIFLWVLLLIVIFAVILIINYNNRLSLSPEEKNLVLYYNFDKFIDVKIPSSLSIEKQGDKFSLGQKFNEFYEGIGNEKLSNVLANESYKNKNGQNNFYSQRIYFYDGLRLENMKDFMNNSVVGINGSGNILNYELAFEGSGAKIEGNTNLKLLGREFYVFDYNSTNKRLILFENISGRFVLRKNMSANNQETININGYDIVLSDNSDLNSEQVALKINSAVNTTLKTGEIVEIPMSNGLYLGIENISYSSAGISEIKLIATYRKVEFIGGDNIIVNNQRLNVFNVSITNEGENVRKISFDYRENIVVYSGKNWVLPYFSTLKIFINNFVQGNLDEVKVKNLESKLGLEVNLKDGKVNMDIAYVDGSVVGLGSSKNGPFLAVDKSNVLSISDAIGKYFVVSNKMESYALSVINISNIGVVTFENKATGARFELGSGEKLNLGENLSILLQDSSYAKNSIIVGVVSPKNISLLNENFETIDLGSLNNAKGWVAINSPSCAEELQSEVVKSGNNALKLADNNALIYQRAYAGHSFAPSKNGRVSFYVRAAQTNQRFYMVLSNSTGYMVVYTYLDSSGSAKYYSRARVLTNFATPKSYSANVWHKVEIEWYADEKFDFWLDGEKLTSNGAVEYSYRNAGGVISSLWLLTENGVGGTGTFYVDDINVLNNTRVEGSFGEIYSNGGLKIELPTSISMREGVGIAFNESSSNKNEKKFTTNFSIVNGKFITGDDNFKKSNKSYFNSEQATMIEREGNNIIIKHAKEESYAQVYLQEIAEFIYPKKILADLSNHGNNGVFSRTEFSKIIYGEGLVLSNKNSVIMPISLLSNTGQYSISVLYKPENINTRQSIISKSNIVGGEILSEGLFYQDEKFVFEHREVRDGGIIFKQAISRRVEPGKMYHVVGVVDRVSEKVLLYVNGEKQEISANLDLGTSAYGYGESPWVIGVTYINESIVQNSAEGFIDEVKIWAGDRGVLSEQDVKEIYDRYKVFEYISKISFPVDCSVESINKTLHSIINGNANLVAIAVNNSHTGLFVCKEYYAYAVKDNLGFVLHGHGSNVNESGNIYSVHTFNFVSADFADLDYKNNLSAIVNLSQLSSLNVMPDVLSNELILLSAHRANDLSANESLDEIKQVLSIAPEFLEGMVQLNSTDFRRSVTNGEQAISWISSANYSSNSIALQSKNLIYSPSILVVAGCLPNWAAYTTNCGANNQRIRYYVESGTNCGGTPPANTTESCAYCSANWAAYTTNCGANNQRIRYYVESGTNCGGTPPANTTESCVYCAANWNSAVTNCLPGDVKVKYYWQSGTNCSETKANETIERCDYESNNLIGTFGEINKNNFDFVYTIADENVNYSKTYNDIKRVEFIEDDIAKVRFDYEFSSTNKLNLPEISVKKQSSGSSYGYIIVKGLNNVKKTVRVNRKTNSNQVCIKDSSSLSDVSSISDDCDGSNEEIIYCDGKDWDGYTCEIKGNYFVVSGLRHSGVKEYVPESSGSSGSSSSSSSGSSSSSSGSSSSSSSSGSGQTSTPYTNYPSSSTEEDNAPSDSNVKDKRSWTGIVLLVLIGLAVILIVILAVTLLRKKENTSGYNMTPVKSSVYAP